MRPSSLWTRGVIATVALAVVSTTAAAGPKTGHRKPRTVKAIAACTSFDQVDREDDGVDLVVANRCEIKLACSVSWSLTCRPAVGKSKKSQHGEAFALSTDAVQTTSATPTACGNDGWVIDDVTWSCQPDPEAKTVATR